MEERNVKTPQAGPTTIDAYIADFPPDVQQVMQEIRTTIREAAPGAEECISYRIPTFKVDGHPVVYFAGFKKHIGLYPVPALPENLEAEVAPFRAEKDSVVFPHDREVPYEMIGRVAREIAAQRVAAND